MDSNTPQQTIEEVSEELLKALKKLEESKRELEQLRTKHELVALKTSLITSKKISYLKQVLKICHLQRLLKSMHTKM